VAKREEIIAGADIGTGKIVVSVLRVVGSGNFELVGIGSTDSHGIRQGVVVHLEAAAESLRQAIAEAERSSGIGIDSLYAGISGTHIRAKNARGVVAISGKEQVVDRYDIERVLDSARTIPIPSQNEIIHMLVQGYTIDELEGIQEPIGLYGRQLEADVHVITAYSGAIKNLVKTIHRSKVGIRGIIFPPLSVGEVLLSESERELGVVLIDIGAATTDLVVFMKGVVWHTASLGFGGEQITRDIAKGIRVTAGEAETLKCKHGVISCVQDETQERDILISGLNLDEKRKLSRNILGDIIGARLEEILEYCRMELEHTGLYDYLAAGAVLTGATSKMLNIADFTEEFLDIPVRIGEIKDISGVSGELADPGFAVSLGLPVFGFRNHEKEKEYQTERGGFAEMAGGFLGWLANIF
jgi:cell division protein FtsA